MAAKFKMASRRLTSVIKLSQTCVFCDNSMKISTHVAFLSLINLGIGKTKKLKWQQNSRWWPEGLKIALSLMCTLHFYFSSRLLIRCGLLIEIMKVENINSSWSRFELLENSQYRQCYCLRFWSLFFNLVLGFKTFALVTDRPEMC